MSKGHSLGALPLGYTEMKVRFGILSEDGEKQGEEWDAVVDVKEGRRGYGAQTSWLWSC